MIKHVMPNLRSFSLLPNSISIIFLSPLHSGSLSPYKSKPNNWNTNHSFVKSNPLLSLLEKCTSMSQLMQVHSQMITTGLILDGLAASQLDAFCSISEAGDLSYGDRILRSLENPNVFSWNIAIRGYSDGPILIKAIVLYREMLNNGGSCPDNYTYPLLFKACGRLSLYYMGHEILGHVLKLGFDSDVFVHNGIIHMLVSCGKLKDARQVFDESCVRDLVTWNTLINGYAHCGQVWEALKLYEEMNLEGVRPDVVTMIGMVASCAQLQDHNRGSEFHGLIQVYGLELTIPLCNALMDMYVKCGDLKEAQMIFDNM